MSLRADVAPRLSRDRRRPLCRPAARVQEAFGERGSRTGSYCTARSTLSYSRVLAQSRRAGRQEEVVSQPVCLRSLLALRTMYVSIAHIPWATISYSRHLNAAVRSQWFIVLVLVSSLLEHRSYQRKVGGESHRELTRRQQFCIVGTPENWLRRRQTTTWRERNATLARRCVTLLLTVPLLSHGINGK